MTLEEAIKHCEEQAEILRQTAAQIARAKSGFIKYEQCRECARDHDQLAEWLKELKAYREAEEEIGRLPLSWEYGQAVTDVWNIFQKHLGKKEQDNIHDVKIERGEWLENVAFYKGCPECGAYVRSNTSEIYLDPKELNFCPCCGAQMKKGGET